MWALVWLVSPSWAIPLWVAPDVVPEARATLEELWPTGAVEVRPAPMIEGETGLLWDGTQLVWSTLEGTHVESAADLATAVLLARTWLREHPEAEVGWIPPVELELPIEPPALERPAVPEGALWFGGIGSQSSLSRGRTWDGVRGTIGSMWPHLEIGVVGFLAVGGSAPPTRVEHLVHDEPGAVTRSVLQNVIFTGYVSWDLGAGRPARIFAKPRVLAGLEVRDGYVRTLTVEPAGSEYDVGPSQIDAGPVFGVGADLWLGVVGLRALAAERFGFVTVEGYGLEQYTFLSLDFVFRP
jgi:hypothetical protein